MLLVHKKQLNKVQQGTDKKPELESGEVLLEVKKYAFTSNNITYAVCGFQLNYWNFFPSESNEWGIVPVWGFAEVIASKHDAIEVGEQVYGYLPMGKYLKVQAGKINTYGFSDAAEHRRKLAPIYNYYTRTAADPSFVKTLEDYIPIIKPLFATSFLIYYYLKENQFFDSEQIVLTSASSKTALALAFMLKQNQASDHKKIIGLTSNGNVAFVENSGYYDAVLSYDNCHEEMDQVSTTVVDFAGNSNLLQSISNALKEQLKNVTLVGLTDWQSAKSFKKIPNSSFFFAPTHIQNKYKEWGAEKTNMLLNTALIGFVKDVQENLEVEYVEEAKAVSKLYLEMLGGKVNPKKGYIVKV